MGEHWAVVCIPSLHSVVPQFAVLCGDSYILAVACCECDLPMSNNVHLTDPVSNAI